MFRNGSTNSSTRLVTLVASALLGLAGALAGAAVPFTEATVTRLQNKVTYGVNVQQRRPAAVQDIIRERNFLLTEIDARAELKYPDGTIVRLGQNTIFSFQAETRTLELKQGALIFYVPDGKGGGLIKTPSLTAAITGTVAAVAVDLAKKTETIVMHEHSVTLLPSGQVIGEGKFVRKNANGSLTVDSFNREKARGGLFSWNGAFPPFREAITTAGLAVNVSDVNQQEILERTVNHPGALGMLGPNPQFGPPPADRTNNRVIVPAPVNGPPERLRPLY
ncbi:MAG: hypothetical protein QOE70_6251 [Chthoniobacter sp.]|nr:hypothetical protein [Chthoniobacter sp.]